jgi:hypothetical protein
MKCKCGGIMQEKRLSIDTTAHICLLCGRDDIPRKAFVDGCELKASTQGTAIVELVKTPRTCPGCGRRNLIFSGRCQRCRYRAERGLDLVTGEPSRVAA